MSHWMTEMGGFPSVRFRKKLLQKQMGWMAPAHGI